MSRELINGKYQAFDPDAFITSNHQEEYGPQKAAKIACANSLDSKQVTSSKTRNGTTKTAALFENVGELPEGRILGDYTEIKLVPNPTSANGVIQNLSNYDNGTSESIDNHIAVQSPEIISSDANVEDVFIQEYKEESDMSSDRSDTPLTVKDDKEAYDNNISHEVNVYIEANQESDGTTCKLSTYNRDHYAELSSDGVSPSKAQRISKKKTNQLQRVSNPRSATSNNAQSTKTQSRAGTAITEENADDFMTIELDPVECASRAASESAKGHKITVLDCIPCVAGSRAPAPSPIPNGTLDVESKALVGGTSEKKATIVDVEKNKKDSKKNRGSCWRQVLAAFIANIGTINTGMVFGFTAMANPQLKDPSSSIPVNEEQASWIASLSSVTTPIGCILSGYLMDKIGRKTTLIITEIPAILGLIVIATATDINMIYVGRLLVGLGSGMVGAPARVYTCEVTQPHLRGMLSALASVGVSLGVLIVYILGALMAWYLMAGISAIIPLLAFILIILMPESPNYLLQRGRTDDARAALRKFRGGSCDVNKELDDMMCFAAKNNVVRLKGFKETLQALVKPSTLKPFGILFLYFLIYQFSGVNSVTFYTVEVFKMSGTDIDKSLVTVILGVVRLISTIISCISLRRCGRRPLTMISAIGCGLSMVGLGTYLFLRDGWVANGVEPVVTWFPVACIFIFQIASTLGFLVVPWIMIGEVYPTQVRGIAGGLTTCSAHIFVFIVVKTFPEFMHLLGIPGTFCMYGSISLVGSLFFYFCLPETKGRSLQEIEDYFCGRVKKLGDRVASSANMPKVLDIPKGKVLP